MRRVPPLGLAAVLSLLIGAGLPEVALAVSVATVLSIGAWTGSKRLRNA